MNFHIYQQANVNSNNISITSILEIMLFNVIIISLRLGHSSVGRMLPDHDMKTWVQSPAPHKMGVVVHGIPALERSSEGHPHYNEYGVLPGLQESKLQKENSLQELVSTLLPMTQPLTTLNEESAGSDGTLQHPLVLQQN